MNLSDDLADAVRNGRAIIRTPFPWWLRPFLARGVAAITLGRHVYVAAASIAQSELESLIRHELVHVRQVARLGFFRFYWRYVAEYVSLRRRGMPAGEAYRNISFEKEALEAEKTL